MHNGMELLFLDTEVTVFTRQEKYACIKNIFDYILYEKVKNDITYVWGLCLL